VVVRRHRIVAAAALGLTLLLAVAGCGDIKAEGDFSPHHAGTLTVATGEIPLVGMWAGTPAHPDGGFEYELARKLAYHYGLKHVDVVVIPFSRLVEGHLGGADLALSDMTATAQREKVLDFSVPYLAATPGVLVRSGQDVSDLETARGLTWAVGRSSTLRDFLETTIKPTGHIVLTASESETSSAVEHHKVDAGLLDLPIASAIARASNGKLAVAGQFDENDDVSAALPQGSDNVPAVDSAIRSLTADGTIASLARRWLGLDLNGTSAQDVPVIRTEGQ
jgi:polar amino acid transport system substrate-binding protein